MKMLLDIAQRIGTHPTTYGKANGRTMTTTRKVTFSVNAAGLGKITIDGMDISNYVQDVDIFTSAGKPPEVHLFLAPCELSAELEAIVEATARTLTDDEQ
jgi:hypothetical protein